MENIKQQKGMKSKKFENISAYLPYKLKWHFEGEDHFAEVVGLDLTNEGLHLISAFGDFGRSSIETGKPLLFPLSSLTKTIKVDGETFVPIEHFEIGDDPPEVIEVDFGNCGLIHDLTVISQHGLHHDIKYLPYDIVQQLIKWKIDIFSMIHDGDAIDASNLNVY